MKTDFKLPKVKVAIWEYESGWGSKIDEIKEFDSMAKAEAFIVKFNKPNQDNWDKTKNVPSWYMTARLA